MRVYVLLPINAYENGTSGPRAKAICGRQSWKRRAPCNSCAISDKAIYPAHIKQAASNTPGTAISQYNCSRIDCPVPKRRNNAISRKREREREYKHSWSPVSGARARGPQHQRGVLRQWSLDQSLGRAKVADQHPSCAEHPVS